MGTTETKVSPLTEDELAEIELPEYETTYVKPQPKYTTGEGVTDKDGNKQTGHERLLVGEYPTSSHQFEPLRKKPDSWSRRAPVGPR